jgi:hypothetical protein
MNVQAVYALYSQVVKTVEDEAFDVQGNKVELDMDAVNAWVDPNAYKAKRAAEYPPIGDQLDALWKGGDAATEMLSKVQAVKVKYPKPEA